VDAYPPRPLEGEFVGRYDVRKGDLIFVSESSKGKKPAK
jgi:hypothetical protein